jgi:hypothetical protein
MRRVTPVKGLASHRAAYRAPEQAPRASAAHPDVTPRAHVPCAVRSATALQRAHRPRAAPRRSVPGAGGAARVVSQRRAATALQAPRMRQREWLVCAVSTRALRAARRATDISTKYTPRGARLQRERAGSAGRETPVSRLRHLVKTAETATAATRDACFLRPPLGTAPLAPARRFAGRQTAPARRGAATKAGCHVIASAGRRTTRCAAPPLARGSSVSAQRVRALLTQRVALAQRVTALQPKRTVEHTLRARLTTTARSAAFIARSWCPFVQAQRATRWKRAGARAAAAAARALPVAAIMRRAQRTVASRAPPSA